MTLEIDPYVTVCGVLPGIKPIEPWLDVAPAQLLPLFQHGEFSLRNRLKFGETKIQLRVHALLAMKPPVNAEPSHLSRSFILGTPKLVRAGFALHFIPVRTIRRGAARTFGRPRRCIPTNTQRLLRLQLAFPRRTK